MSLGWGDWCLTPEGNIAIVRGAEGHITGRVTLYSTKDKFLRYETRQNLTPLIGPEFGTAEDMLLAAQILEELMADWENGELELWRC